MSFPSRPKMPLIFFFLILLLNSISTQMVPVPDLEEDPSLQTPDPFKLPQNKKFTDQFIVNLTEPLLEELLISFPHSIILFQQENQSEITNAFEKLAKNMKKKYQLIFAVCTIGLKDQKILQRFKTDKMPSIFFIEKTKKHLYNGNLTNLTQIRSFLIDFLARDLIILKTPSDFQDFFNKPNRTKLLALYTNEMKNEKKLLEEMLTKDLFSDSGSFLIAWTSDQSIIPIPSDIELPSLILYNDFEEGEGKNTIKYEGEFTSGEEILSFCQLNSLPLVTVFSEETSFRLFAGPVEVQMLLLLKKEKDNRKEIEEFKKASKYNFEEELYYERIMFIIAYYEEENQELLEFFGINHEEKEENARIFLTKTDNKQQKLNKYLYAKDEINEEFIKDFIKEFRRKELPLYFKSEKIVDNTGRWPLSLVGSEFVNKVIRSRDNYIILFCSDMNEKFCKGARKYFEKIAEKIDIGSRSIVNFAYFDVDKNEVFLINSSFLLSVFFVFSMFFRLMG